jgi:membrane associated rhomboid family serine protease
MIPLRDVIPSRTTPVVTIALIAANVFVYLWQMSLPDRELERFFMVNGLVPADFSWGAAFTSMFVHANAVHAISNLLCLWIFGDNVEDRMGHFRFLGFYVMAGLAAALAQTWADPGSTIPLVGASGAIAGVMGAYLLLFPHSRVLVLVFLFLFIDIIEIPAIIFLGIWFVMQLLLGVGRTAAESSGGGIAYWAHAAGFAVGLAGAALLRRPRWEG